MSFDQFISHPGNDNTGPTPLVGETDQTDETGHLRMVSSRMKSNCQGLCLVDGTSAATVAEVIGLTHDFTKLTTWAQKHLRGESFQESTTYTYHSFSSALVTLYCLSEHHPTVSDYAAEIATLAVIGHHNTRSPPDRSAVGASYGQVDNEQVRAKYERTKKQFENIDTNAVAYADTIINEATNGQGSWRDFFEWNNDRISPLDGVHDHLVYFAEMADGSVREGYYQDLLMLWTALKFSDQTAASGLTGAELDGQLPNRRKLEDHVADLDDGEGVIADLNDLRDQARRQATQNITEILDTDTVGLITLPTGFGKTYAGLSAGLRAAAIKESRLVYVLPYTSILDQTAQEIESVFNVTPYSEEFTLHHHLSDTYTNLSDRYIDGDIGRSPGALHAESWRSGLTLTTTVQLFESLTAPTARQATKLPSLRDATVVIDEPQTIPEDWWQIVPKLIELLVKTYGTTVILMTATQPGIVKYGSDTVDTTELIDDPEDYINFLSSHPRVVYRLDDSLVADGESGSETVEYHHAGSRLVETAAGNESILAICNTRASARDLYRAVLDQHEDAVVELGRLLHEYVERTGALPTAAQLRKLTLKAVEERQATTVCVYLSGDVRPADRALLIDALYDEDVSGPDAPGPLLDTDISVILVSTTVVEAGVDISFDVVFRDYAPIPNLVQSGGRCNRSFEDESGEVVVWRLATPEDGEIVPSLAIHGNDGGDALPVLHVTGQILQTHASQAQTIDEAAMASTVVADFYERLFEGQLDPGNERLAEYLKSAATANLEGKHMITEIDDYEDVIVCLTDQERSTLLSDGLSTEIISKHPGAQVTAKVQQQSAMQVDVENRSYHIIDARENGYHPVFGVE